MTHTVHPYAHRLGVLRDWKSRWFGGGTSGQYQEFLKTDILLREYLEKRLRGFYVADLEMERTKNDYRIIVKTSRPGMVIGRSGEGTTRLKQDVLKQLKKITTQVPKNVKIDIEEVKDPESEASILAYMIAEGLERRLPFRRVMKQTVEKAMGSKNVQGVKINLSGRLGGADMSRKETQKEGRIPLQTLRADVDFAREKAYLTYGVIGIKVWVYLGEVFDGQENKE